jgi:hypothetical protein
LGEAIETASIMEVEVMQSEFIGGITLGFGSFDEIRKELIHVLREQLK